MTKDAKIVTADYLRRAAEQLAALKEASYNQMAIDSGDTVLDAGCGPGIDAAALAGRVGPSGRVIAIDVDANMLKEAKNYALAQGVLDQVEFHEVSALELPIGNGSVAASRAERLIQVLPPEIAPSVVAELRRVTRPGGRVVLVDTDWGSASVDFVDVPLERKLMGFFAEKMRPNGMAGRQLYRLALDSGLVDVQVEAISLVQHRLDATPLDWIGETAKNEGLISEGDHRRWQESLRRAEADGRLFMQATMVTVWGTIPD